MKNCAQNPCQPEYTICGNACDSFGDIGCEDIEEFRHVELPGERVTCEDCLRAIKEIHETFTPKGKVK